MTPTSRRSALGALALFTTVLGSTMLVPSLSFAQAAPTTPTQGEPDRTLELRVEGAYHPDTLHVVAGEKVRLVVTRVDYGGCTRHIVFPTLGIKVELPTGQPVTIDLPALEPGTIPFHCGMKMIHGTVHVAPRQG